jgi:hypothetical protein
MTARRKQAREPAADRERDLVQRPDDIGDVLGGA